MEERRLVTVLFADVVGFTSIAERLDPEDVRALLGPLYALLRSKLVGHGGTIEQFTGDGVMALFGAAVAHGDDPERAVRAALDIREAVTERNAQNPGDAIDVRIGVNTGTVIVSRDPLGRAGERLVAGDAVNLAARLQAAAPVDGVLVGDLTHRATAAAIEYRELAPIAVKGKADRVPVWEAVAPRSRHPGAAAFASQAPFVGRDAELDFFSGLLDRVRAEREPHFVVLVGDAGVGKTRLLLELVERERRRDRRSDARRPTLWRLGHCLPYGEYSSYGALAEIVKAQAGILKSDEPAQAAAKLRADLARRHRDDELEWLDGEVRLLVGLAGDREPERSTTYAAWRRWLEAAALARPLVLVVEDIQWADESLLAFLSTLDRVRGVPLVVIAATRPELLERSREWAAGKENATTLVLEPLDRAETAELVDALLDGGAVRESVRAPIVTSSGGNPFFAEEYVRMFRDRGLLHLRDGEWSLRAAQEALPVTVQGTLAARIDALTADEKALLLDASVVGPAFWTGALERLSAQPRPHVQELLRALEERELIRREPRPTIAGEDEFVFRHALVREVAYGLIPRARRAARHRAAAEWVESLGGDSDHTETRAHHYAEALAYAEQEGTVPPELAAAARRAFRDAGERAARTLARARAVDQLERALRLWPADAERPRLLLALGRAKYHHDQGGEEELRQAREQLRAAGDLEGVAEAGLQLSHLWFARGRREESLTALREAHELLSAEPLSATKIRVLATLAGSLSIADQNEEALAIAAEAVELADAFGDDALRARALRSAGMVRTAVGDDEGFDDVERSIAISRRLNLAQQVPALANLGAAWWTRGDLARTWELEAQAREACERFGDDFLLRWLRMKQAREAYWRGDWDEALAIAEDLLEESSRGYAAAFLLIVCGKIRLARGDVSGAVESTDAALAEARSSRDSQIFYPALIAHADSLWAAGRRHEAEALLAELLGRLTGRESFMGDSWADLAFALVRAGRGGDLCALAGKVQSRTRWLDAAEQLCSDEALAAATTFAEIGSVPDEALARLLAAEELVRAHDLPAAERALELARSFFDRVHADHYTARAEALRAALV